MRFYDFLFLIAINTLLTAFESSKYTMTGYGISTSSYKTLREPKLCLVPKNKSVAYITPNASGFLSIYFKNLSQV